jgi:hypothetical protein
MRGSTRIGLLAVSLVCLFAFVASSAFAGPRFWTDKTKTTLLRDVNATPKNQPDALEFANNGNVVLETGIGTITCTEIEFGTTVVSNTETLAKVALPFGVAEGDNCSTPIAGQVATYFDTLANGAAGNATNGNVASVTVTEPGGVKTATVNDLKFSQNIPGIGFCTGNLNGITGTITNEEFVNEEKTPNLNVQFTKAKVPIESSGGIGCPKEGTLTANFFLETMSTKTDNAFVG